MHTNVEFTARILADSAPGWSLLLRRAGPTLPMLLGCSLVWGGEQGGKASSLENCFVEITETAGLTYIGTSYGIAVADINGDGYPDIYTTNHGQRDAIWINHGGSRFANEAKNYFTPDDFEKLGHRPNATPEWWDTHGAAWADFDNDGDQDLALLTGGDQGIGVGPNGFFVNRNGRLTDEAAARGVDYPPGRSRAALWADLDNDGRLDLVNGVVGRPDGTAPLKIFRQLASGSFEDATGALGIRIPQAFFTEITDLDNDGAFELLFREQGNNAYQVSIHSTRVLPLAPPVPGFKTEKLPWGEDFVCADLNNDLRPDVYLTTLGYPLVSQCQLFDATTLSFSFELDRKPDSEDRNSNAVAFATEGDLDVRLGEWKYLSKTRMHPANVFLGAGAVRLQETDLKWESDNSGNENYGLMRLALKSDDERVQGVTPISEAAAFGTYIGYDKARGCWHLRASSPERHNITGIVQSTRPISIAEVHGFPHPRQALPERLYVNSGTELVERSVEAGIAELTVFGRSVVAGDFDNDTDLDLYLVNATSAGNLKNVLLENLGGAAFRSVPEAGGAAGSPMGVGDSAGLADFDRDGFLDIALTNGEWAPMFMELGPLQLFRNRGNGNHWLQIDLVGTVSNRDAIGAKVYLTADGATQYREQNGGFHRDSQNFKRIHFGLGQSTRVTGIRILWPSGIEQTFNDIPADQIIQVKEPKTEPRRPALRMSRAE